MIWLRQSTAATVPFGPILSTDGVTLMNDYPGTLELIKNGATASLTPSSASEMGDGMFALGLSTSHTDTAGSLVIYGYDEGVCLPCWMYMMVVPATTYDALIAGTAFLPVELGASLSGVEYTYTVTSSVTGNPIAGVTVRFSSAADGSAVVWSGVTDSFGVARDLLGNLPTLDAGTYYVFRTLAGWSFDDPDEEEVS